MNRLWIVKNRFFQFALSVQKIPKIFKILGILSGTPEGTRTPDLLIRSQSLYPTELPAHTFAERLDIVAQGAKFVKHFLRSTGNIFENEGGSGEKK